MKTRSYYQSKKYLKKIYFRCNKKKVIIEKEVEELQNIKQEEKEEIETKPSKTLQTEIENCPFCKQDPSLCGLFTVSNQKVLLFKNEQERRHWVCLPHCLRSGCDLNSVFVEEAIRLLALSLPSTHFYLKLLCFKIVFTMRSKISTTVKNVMFAGTVTPYVDGNDTEKFYSHLFKAYSRVFLTASSTAKKTGRSLSINRLILYV